MKPGLRQSSIRLLWIGIGLACLFLWLLYFFVFPVSPSQADAASAVLHSSLSFDTLQKPLGGDIDIERERQQEEEDKETATDSTPEVKQQDMCSLGALKKFQSSNIHLKIADAMDEIALSAQCDVSTPRTFVRTGHPHFWAGWKIFASYFAERNWIERTQSGRYQKPNDLLMASCLNTVNIDELKKYMTLMSTVRNEHALSGKRAFFEAVRDRFLFTGCDYREFHFEAYLIRNQDTCKSAQRTFSEKLPKDNTWHFLGELYNADLVHSTDQARMKFPNCEAMVITPVLVVKQFDHAVWTKSRSYLLVSSFYPEARAWYFRGMEFHSHAVKRTMLQTFLVIKAKLGVRERGSFSLVGVDYVQHKQDGSVHVLGVNCNCELYSSVEKFGEAKVAMSKSLVKGMMDIVLASNLKAEVFSATLTDIMDEEELKSEEASQTLEPHAWELLYSENPDFQYSSHVC